MNGLSAYTIDVGGVKVSLASLLAALGIMMLGFLLASRLSRRVRGENAAGGGRRHWRAMLAKITSYAVRVVTVVIALQVAGVNLASVLAAGAVVAVGVGLAMQKVAENFVSGVILMVERSIREGDIIEFDGRVARVVYIGIRATIAQTIDDEEIIVPNSVLAQSAVKNLTLTESIYRLRVRVGVAYGSDLAAAEAALHAAADSLDWRVPGRPPVVLLMDFGPSSIDFEVSVWTSDVWAMRRGQSAMRKAIWRELRAIQIGIPYPQMDIHLDPATVEHLRGRDPGRGPAAEKASPTGQGEATDGGHDADTAGPG